MKAFKLDDDFFRPVEKVDLGCQQEGVVDVLGQFDWDFSTIRQQGSERMVE